MAWAWASSSAPFDARGFVFVGTSNGFVMRRAHGLNAGEHILILQHLQTEFGTGRRRWARVAHFPHHYPLVRVASVDQALGLFQVKGNLVLAPGFAIRPPIIDQPPCSFNLVGLGVLAEYETFSWVRGTAFP